ncbi:hypothetical protein INQ51_08300 [Maribellus sp. CM-23]|uniref:hypothetical protein n=1 Tax=Maribellus sp. CM-23 TaxID=2781026 RepID=UPI001F411AD9|nr:hypothetical protein [Maribellus sp. CM-23]MCE4564311.1 hypothetical protein [Maribellus sp. CM-23]
MNTSSVNNKISIPHLLLIAGNGRNVGKTFLACSIIKQLSQKTPVCGVKITPHFHAFEEKNVLFKNENLIILEEKQLTQKDSSLMLQAGADRVLFVMTKKASLGESMEQLLAFLPNSAIVCESGGLHEYVEPGLFLFVNLNDREIQKKHLLGYKPVYVHNSGKNFDLDIKTIEFSNHQFRLKHE